VGSHGDSGPEDKHRVKEGEGRGKGGVEKKNQP